jgi:hypothetical protein
MSEDREDKHERSGGSLDQDEVNSSHRPFFLPRRSSSHLVLENLNFSHVYPPHPLTSSVPHEVACTLPLTLLLGRLPILVLRLLMKYSPLQNTASI